MRPYRIVAAILLLIAAAASTVFAQAPIAYRLTFPEPEHRWMQVDVTFPDLPAGPFELHMSRSSPGRYALHAVRQERLRRAGQRHDGRDAPQ